ncbi:MAG: hypothetical protein LBI13_02820 [Streptococcaceae bacterium]|jgi:HJR/Mrr/RecB family endonuclease|nr:hypothetical protein [Streptococcaceae bacterium]
MKKVVILFTIAGVILVIFQLLISLPNIASVSLTDFSWIVVYITALLICFLIYTIFSEKRLYLYLSIGLYFIVGMLVAASLNEPQNIILRTLGYFVILSFCMIFGREIYKNKMKGDKENEKDQH